MSYVTEIPGTVPDTLQKFCKNRVLYRQSYRRSFCKNRVLCESRTNTRGYCAASATEPTQGSGIVLKGVQTSENNRVPVLSKKSTLDTLCEYPTEHTFEIMCLRVVGETMIPQGIHSLLRNVLVVVGTSRRVTTLSET